MQAACPLPLRSAEPACEEGVTVMRVATLHREEVPALYLLVSRALQELLLELPFFLCYLSHLKIDLEEKKMH